MTPGQRVMIDDPDSEFFEKSGEIVGPNPRIEGAWSVRLDGLSHTLLFYEAELRPMTA